ncbi:MAG: response regulator [Pseudomonadota bacterium]
MRAQILVIDDDPIVTRMLSRVLSGHDVHVAHTGSEGLEQVRNHAFDVILCDLAMPGMSGIEFYRAVRELSPTVADRVVFMTGGAFTAEGHEFLAKLPNSRLEKPFDLGTLREVVKTAL